MKRYALRNYCTSILAALDCGEEDRAVRIYREATRDQRYKYAFVGFVSGGLFVKYGDRATPYLEALPWLFLAMIAALIAAAVAWFILRDLWPIFLAIALAVIGFFLAERMGLIIGGLVGFAIVWYDARAADKRAAKANLEDQPPHTP